MQLVIKNNGFIPSNKNKMPKYPRIFKKFKKMIKNARKIAGGMRTSNKNLNLCVNWKKQ